jgi:hypothetical protein
MFEEGKSKRPPFVHSVIRNLNLFETRSLPALTRCYPRSFTFYVAPPDRSIRISSRELRIFAKGDRVNYARRPVMVSVVVSPWAVMLEVTSDSPSPKNSVWTMRADRTISDPKNFWVENRVTYSLSLTARS